MNELQEEKVFQNVSSIFYHAPCLVILNTKKEKKERGGGKLLNDEMILKK